MKETVPTPELLLDQQDWMLRLARSLVRGDEDAQDLVQRTWLAVLRRPPEHLRSVRSWLRTVMVNQARVEHRGNQRRADREAQVTAQEPAAAPDEFLAKAEMLQRVGKLVLELDEPFRTALVLRYQEGLSTAEIARQTKVATVTVRTRIKTGLDRIRARMDQSCGGNRAAWASVLIRGRSVASVATLGWLVVASAVAASIAVPLWLSHPDTELEAPLEAQVVEVQDAPRASIEGVAPEQERQAAAASPVQHHQGSVQEAEPTPAPVVLQGRLVDSDRNPIEGVSVLARPSSTEEPDAVVRSDEDGRFTLRVPVDEEWREAGRQPLHLTAEHVAWRSWVNREYCSIHGEDYGEIVLKPGCAIRGRVIDEFGSPVAGAVVAACRPSPIREWAPLRGDRMSVSETSSDSDGEFLLIGIPPGTWRVWANTHFSQFAWSDTISLGIADLHGNVVLQLQPLPPEHILELELVDEAGHPFAEQQFSFRQMSRQYQYASSAHTGPDGRLRLRLYTPPPIELTVRIESTHGPTVIPEVHPLDGPVRCVMRPKEKEKTSDSPPRLAPPSPSRPATVSGLVTHRNGTPAEDTALLFVSDISKKAAQTDAAGRYATPRLQPGKWKVYLSEFPRIDHVWFSEGQTYFVTEIEVGSGERRELDVVCPDSVQVTGHISIDEAPAAGWFVQFAGSGVQHSETVDREVVVELDEDGRFELKSAFPGERRLNFRGMHKQEECNFSIDANLEEGWTPPVEVDLSLSQVEVTLDEEDLDGVFLFLWWKDESGARSTILRHFTPDGPVRMYAPHGPAKLQVRRLRKPSHDDILYELDVEVLAGERTVVSLPADASK